MKKKELIKVIENLETRINNLESLSKSMNTVIPSVKSDKVFEITKEFLTQDDVVFNCETLKEVDWLASHTDRLGIIWGKNGKLSGVNYWHKNKGLTCYKFNKRSLAFYADVDYYIEKGKTIYKVSDLINDIRNDGGVEANEVIENKREETMSSYFENSKIPAIGDLCLFWDRGDDYERKHLGMLLDICLDDEYPYRWNAGGVWKQCKKVTIEEAREYYGIKR